MSPVTRAPTPARVTTDPSNRAVLRSTAVLAAVCALAAAGCGDHARLLVREGMGPAPALPPPVTHLIPTLAIASAQGWAPGTTPVASP